MQKTKLYTSILGCYQVFLHKIFNLGSCWNVLQCGPSQRRFHLTAKFMVFLVKSLKTWLCWSSENWACLRRRSPEALDNHHPTPLNSRNPHWWSVLGQPLSLTDGGDWLTSSWACDPGRGSKPGWSPGRSPGWPAAAWRRWAGSRSPLRWWISLQKSKQHTYLSDWEEQMQWCGKFNLQNCLRAAKSCGG